MRAHYQHGRGRVVSIRTLFAAAATVLIVGLVAGNSGCGTDSNRSREARDIVGSGGHGPLAASYYSGTYGSLGGTLAGSSAWFTIPSGALSVPTTITMELQPAGGLNGHPTDIDEIVMGPDGQTFASSCTLNAYKPIGWDPEDVYHIALWDEENEEWDDIGGANHGYYVSASISHFSRYKVIQIIQE